MEVVRHEHLGEKLKSFLPDTSGRRRLLAIGQAFDDHFRIAFPCEDVRPADHRERAEVQRALLMGFEVFAHRPVKLPETVRGG